MLHFLMSSLKYKPLISELVDDYVTVCDFEERKQLKIWGYCQFLKVSEFCERQFEEDVWLLQIHNKDHKILSPLKVSKFSKITLI